MTAIPRRCTWSWRSRAPALMRAVVIWCAGAALRPAVGETAGEIADLRVESYKLYMDGRYREAEPLARRLADITEKRFGGNDVRLAGPLVNLVSARGGSGSLPTSNAQRSGNRRVA